MILRRGDFDLLVVGVVDDIMGDDESKVCFATIAKSIVGG